MPEKIEHHSQGRPKDWDPKTGDGSDTGRVLVHEKARGGPIQPALDFDLAWSEAAGHLELTLRDVRQSAAGRLTGKAADAAAFVRERGRVTTGEIAEAIRVSPRSVRRWRRCDRRVSTSRRARAARPPSAPGGP